MGVLKFPEWQKPCEIAFLEPDPEKLFLRVIAAETAIYHRLHGITSTPENIELQAIDEALKNLERLITHTFTSPISEEGSPNEPLRIAQDRLKPTRQGARFSPLYRARKTGVARMSRAGRGPNIRQGPFRS